MIRFLLQTYRLCLSPLLGCRCRFIPTCSEYAEEACARHGLLKGPRLAARRLLRCHPFATHGHDPVP